MVHAVLERLFDLPPSERTLARAATLLQPAWEGLLEVEPELSSLFTEEPETAEQLELPEDPGDSLAARDSGFAGWMASAVDLLRCYFTLEDPQRLEPADREVYVETVLDSGLALRGYVDRIDVSATGDVRVVDYKTGRAPGENFEARALFQMRFYALVVWRLRGVVPRMLQLLYLGSGEVLRYEPDEADLRATERKLLALWAAISRAIGNRRLASQPQQEVRLVCSSRAVSGLWRDPTPTSRQQGGPAGARRPRSRGAVAAVSPGRAVKSPS